MRRYIMVHRYVGICDCDWSSMLSHDYVLSMTMRNSRMIMYVGIRMFTCPLSKSAFPFCYDDSLPFECRPMDICDISNGHIPKAYLDTRDGVPSLVRPRNFLGGGGREQEIPLPYPRGPSLNIGGEANVYMTSHEHVLGR